MKPVLLAIDQGTTSVRASVLDADLAPLGTHAEIVPRNFPRAGWVELDAAELVAATERVMREALARAGRRVSDVAGVGFANQGETVVVWDRATGEPVGPAIVWQCRRTEDACADLRKQPGLEDYVRARTGLPIDAYFSATKLAWILDEIPGARARAERGELAAGTLDAFTIFRLSSGARFVTDPSTSCRTLLARLDDGRFDDDLCRIFRVPQAMLPEVVASDHDVGAIRVDGGHARLFALLCDQPSALLGSGCVAIGDAKCTYGTGAFLQVNTGDVHTTDNDGLLRSIAWEARGKRTYLLEGGVLSAGDVLTWLCDGLGVLARPDAVDALLASTPDAAGVMFAPALTGLGAPRWVGDARGTILGLHRGVRREHLVRAALEGVAHQVADILELAAPILSARGASIGALWADGGLAASLEFLRLQADLAGQSLRRAPHAEATTRGVAALAAVGAGLAPSLEALVHTRAAASVEPTLDPFARDKARARHKRLLDVATSREVIDLCSEGRDADRDDAAR
jgi:glycerol kinase